VLVLCEAHHIVIGVAQPIIPADNQSLHLMAPVLVAAEFVVLHIKN